MTDESTQQEEGTEPIQRLWGTLKRGLQDGAEIAVSKAEALTQIGRARLDVAAAKTRLGRLQAQLGEQVFDRYEAGEENLSAQDEQIDGLRVKIRQARADLAAVEDAFHKIRACGDA